MPRTFKKFYFTDWGWGEGQNIIRGNGTLAYEAGN